MREKFYTKLRESFKHTPTRLQDRAIELLTDFLISSNYDQKVFLLKGYAGTGKTTLIKALTDALEVLNMKSVLLAPTGRAAKVIQEYTKRGATTIHRHIYMPKTKDTHISFQLRKNTHSKTLFIVDESSMLSDRNESELFQSSLLNDLFKFVYSKEKCTLLIIGDTAQLPPVFMDSSPALQADYLEFQFNKKVVEIELNEVMRQSSNSGILYNATQIRMQLQESFTNSFQIRTSNFKDIVPLIGSDIQETIQDSFQYNGIDQTNFIVRSNKRAVQYNTQIRKVILGYDAPLVNGDLLMVVKNNYFWLKPSSKAGFIANGDIIKILQIHQYKQLYGFEFAEVTVKMIDYPEQEPFQTILLLDTLTSLSPSLSYEENQKLYEEVKRDYQHKSPFRKYIDIKNNPYFNALQVKYSYAVTCHKSQGGQWNTIFIEKPFLPNGIDREYLRWLYTAITRAQKKVYLIGFKPEDFNDF